MKTVIFGATGMLGRALVKEAAGRGISYIACADSGSEVNFDITNDSDLKDFIIQAKPEVLINTCAIVDHKFCDENPGIAYKVNARPSALLAQMASEYKFKYIYISTDGYFNGLKNTPNKEDANIMLLNEYARTKYTGETFTLTCSDALVLRTNIVGFRGDKSKPTFVEWAISALKNMESMILFDDYYTSSISVTQFSKALFDLLTLPNPPKGVLNLASSQISSKKEFIYELAAQFGFKTDNTRTGSVNSLASRRADSLGLDVSKAQAMLGYKLPDLKAVIAQLKKEFDNV